MTLESGMLTVKQEAFALAYVEIGNASEAYRHAYNAERMKSVTVNRKAFELLENGKITARLDELRAELAERNLWARERSVRALIQVIENPDRQADIIAAVKVLNEMHGYNAPDRLEVNGAPLPSHIMIDWGDEKQAMLEEIEKRADAGLG